MPEPEAKEPTRAEQKAAKQAARSDELQRLMVDLNRQLEEHDAAFDVAIIVRVRNGQEVREIQLGLISK
jgi:hypothetical protein